MKTSELISKLQQIQKSVPFDADLVMGDDWMPSSLIKVFHEPPHTFLEFEECVDTNEVDEQISESQEKQVRLYISHLLLRYRNQQDVETEIIDQLFDLIVLFKDYTPDAAVTRMSRK